MIHFKMNQMHKNIILVGQTGCKTRKMHKFFIIIKNFRSDPE